MSFAAIRTEQHALVTTPEIRADMARTVSHYRRVVRLCATIALTHWPELGSLSAKDRAMALERLVHATKARPEVRYPMMRRVLGQMPSYLRRAALAAALGAVASFLSNYANWLKDPKRPRGVRPPRLGFSHVFPSLYGGNMILEGAHLKTVAIKLLDVTGQWRFSPHLKLRGKLKRLPHRLDKSPNLLLKGARALLVCPAQALSPRRPKFTDVRRVCAVDVGINTPATAVIVDNTGTVIARKFLTCGRHDGRRDSLTAQIATLQSQINGKVGRGFCQTLHRRIAGLSRAAARQLSAQLVAFALRHQAQAFVFEDLKGWKPKGHGAKQRKCFHRFQHRALLQAVALRAEELGMPLLTVYARGTSRWAYDGSGKVTRDKRNAQLATFASGKRYDADLNGAQNIAARGLAVLYGIKTPRSAKAPDGEVRMPLVLSDVWAWARTTGATLTASGVSVSDAHTKLPLAA